MNWLIILIRVNEIVDLKYKLTGTLVLNSIIENIRILQHPLKLSVENIQFVNTPFINSTHKYAS